MRTISAKGHKLYVKLCDEYIKKNVQRVCSLQTFLTAKYKQCKNPTRAALIYEVIQYAETDF